MNKVTALNAFESGVLPNHVLINEYSPGQGIMVCQKWKAFSSFIMYKLYLSVRASRKHRNLYIKS